MPPPPSSQSHPNGLSAPFPANFALPVQFLQTRREGKLAGGEEGTDRPLSLSEFTDQDELTTTRPHTKDDTGHNFV